MATFTVAKQVLVIFAVTNGFLDEFQVEQCGQFETELFKYFDVQHKDLLEQLGGADGMSDELRESLKKALTEFTEQFKATHAAVA